MKRTETKEKEPVPTLTCTKKATKNCNNATYKVVIPVKFMPVGVLSAQFYEYYFIGMKEV